jgi:hypothetical protein
MKAIGLCACLGTVVLLVTTAMAQSSAAPFSLSATAVHSEVKSGDEVYVSVTLTNKSNRLAAIEFVGPICDYAVEVRDSAGHPVPDTEVRSKLDCARGESGADGIVRLKPNESATNKISVSMFSNMSRPGVYSVQVAWRTPKEIGAVVVRSNTIKITVTP